MNLSCWWGMDLMVIATSWYRLASWSRRPASMRTSTVPEFMLDCRLDNLLERSGLVLVEAYCKDPISPLRGPRSLSVIGRLAWSLREFSIGIGDIFRHSLIGWGWYWSHCVGLHQFRWTWRSYFSWIQTKTWLQVSSAPLLELWTTTANDVIDMDPEDSYDVSLRWLGTRDLFVFVARLHLLSGQTRKDQRDRLPFPTAWVLLPGHNPKGMGHWWNHKLPYWVGLFHWVASEGLPLALELGQWQLICIPGVGLVRKLPLYRRIEAAMHVMLLAARWPYVMIYWV